MQKASIKTVKEIVEENGFSYEEYKVTTKDDYILTLMRIPGKASEKYSQVHSAKPALLL